jgi:hypothetical protein
VLSGCGGSSDSSVDQNSPQRVDATGTGIDSTQQILESIYHNRRTPDGFYTEQQPDPGVFQTIAHIKNIDVMPPGDFDGTTAQYELCAHDFSEALTWSTIASTNLGDLVDNSEDVLFYQFTYTQLATPEHMNLQRVYKCNMIDRSAMDTLVPGEYLGRYTETMQNQLNIKLLIEYLWSFTDLNNYGNAILSSTVSDAGDYYLHVMEHARLSDAPSLGATCDRIDVYLVSYQIQKTGGEITVSEVMQHSIYSLYRNGEAIICKE